MGRGSLGGAAEVDEGGSLGRAEPDLEEGMWLLLKELEIEQRPWGWCRRMQRRGPEIVVISLHQ